MRRLKLLRAAFALAVFGFVNLFFLGLVEGGAMFFKLQLLPAMLGLNALAVGVVLAATFLFGRVYCSVVCPMGIFQDVVIRVSRWFRRKDPPAKRRIPPPPRGIRYVFLAMSILLAAFGLFSLGALFDGYSLYGRIVTQLFRPLLAHEEGFFRGGLCFMIAVAGLVGVVMLAWWRGRLFCNTLCPVGALLAVVAKRPVVRIAIDETSCVKCGLCASACKCGAIDIAGRKVDDASCVRCFNCLSACRRGAIGLRARC